MLTGIQILRGLAAALVVFHHYIGTAVAKGFASGDWTSTQVGNVGVDIFFVISGFIIEHVAGSPRGAGTSPGRFVLRRAIRIAPLCWALTLLACLIHRFVSSEGGGPESWQRIVMSLLFLPDSASSEITGAYVIPMAWSLSYEIYFYLLFALMLTLPSARRLKLLALLFCASVGLRALGQPDNLLVGLVSDPMLFEFLGGCLLAALWRTGLRVGLSISVVAIVAAAASLLVMDHFAILSAVWGVPAWFIVASVVLARARAPALLALPLASLGDVSYSLYLTQYFSVSAFQRLVTHLAWLHERSPWLLAMLFAGLALAVAYACYHLIEQPSRRLLNRWLLADRTPTLGAVPAPN